MDTAELHYLYDNVEQAVDQVRTTFRGRVEITEILDRFWCLQDELARLLEAVNDSRGSAPHYGGLIRKVVDVLEAAKMFNLTSIPAVRSSCEAINEYLLALQQTKERFRAAGTA